MNKGSANPPVPRVSGPPARLRELGLIFLVTLIVYLPCLDNGFVNFDDPAFITENARVQNPSPENLRSIWADVNARPYYPLVFTLYMAGSAVWDNLASGFHALSLALHILNALLTYVLILKLYRSRFVALLTGVLVGLHPVHVDAVAWASDLKDVLSATLILASVVTYLGYVRRESRLLYYLSLLLYAAALTAKPLAVLLPFLLLIIDYQQRRKDRRLELLEKVPFLAIAAVLIGIAIHSQAGLPGNEPEAARSFYSRHNAVAAIGFYLVKLIAPLRLTVLYGSEHSALWLTVAVALSVAFVAATLWVLMLSREYGFGLAWFLLLAFPMLGFVPYRYVVQVAPFANHFMYLADIGIFTVAALIGRDVWKGLANRRERAVLMAIIGVALCLFSVKTVLRCEVWSSSERLWRDALRYNRSPNRIIAHINLARALQEKGDHQGAMEHTQAALDINPRSPRARALLKELASERPAPRRSGP